MKKSNKYKCSKCGGPVSVSSGRHGGMCSKCSHEQVRDIIHARSVAKWEKLNKEDPHYCVICGKQIVWNWMRKAQNTKTCSRRCASLMMQQRRKETPEHLQERLVSYIKEQHRYVSLKEHRKVFHISDKLLYARGLSCPDLNRKAGNYFPTNDRSVEQLSAQYAELIKKNKGLKQQEAVKLLGVSYEYMRSIGVDMSGIKASLGIHNRHSRTKEEVHDLVVNWLRKQPTYCTVRDVCSNLHIDFLSSIKKNGLDIAELNIEAGHNTIPESYYEAWTKYRLKELGFSFVAQKTFAGCRNKHLLRFDFWLQDYNTLIEIDGSQHSRPSYGIASFERTKKNDSIKNEYAKSNGIPLYRLPTQPHKTFKHRLDKIIEQIKGLPRVNGEVRTDSNCWEIRPDKAEDNQQPSSGQIEFVF